MRNLILIRYILAFLLVISCGGLNASDDSLKSEFKKAYSKYHELYDKGESKKSLKYIKKSLELGLEIYGDSHHNTGVIATNYYIALLDADKYDDAYKMAVRAVGYYEKAHGANSPKLIPALKDAARASLWSKSIDSRPDGHVNRAAKIVENSYGPNSVEFGNFYLEAADVLYSRRLKYPLITKKFYKKADEVLTVALGVNDPKVTVARRKIADLTAESGEVRGSLKYYEAVVESMERGGEPDSAALMALRAMMVSAYERFGLREKATKHCLAIGDMVPFDPNQEYVPLFKPSPKFPKSALRDKKSGWVLLEYSVDQNGFVKNPVILDSDGHLEFHQPSLDSVLKYRYAPRFINGEAVTVDSVKNRIVYNYVDSKVIRKFYSQFGKL